MALSLRAARPVPHVPELPPVESLLESPRVAAALAAVESLSSWTTDEIIAGDWSSDVCSSDLVRRLFAANGLRTRMDPAGNVIGERPGASRKDVLLISAHLDTVFPSCARIKVQRDGRRLSGPGISDNAAGLAAVVCLARVFHEAKLRTRHTIVFAANTAEEGEGNLRGMRKLVDTFADRLRAVIAVDGAATDHITSMALASRRLEIALTGPGGHSWADFGMPNPVHALTRGVAKFLASRVPGGPRTTYNVGVIEGGSSVNTIADRALVKVDLRSESEAELDRAESTLRKAIEAGVAEEMACAREAGHLNDPSLQVCYRSLGERPGGELAADAPLLEAVRQADRYLDNQSRLERSSTDANIPLSLGIPAVAVGGGGRSGGAHSPGEWYDPSGRELGVKRILLTALAIAGLES